VKPLKIFLAAITAQIMIAICPPEVLRLVAQLLRELAMLAEP
jgi:hypothetical protein